MPIGRFLLPLAAVTGVAFLSLAPASAEDYPPEEPALSVSAGTVVAGNSVTLTGTGFDPGEEITIEVSYGSATALQFPPGGAGQAEPVAATLVSRSVPALAAQSTTADADGAFSATVTLTQTGQATITATGQSSGQSVSVVVTVVADADALPATGSSSGGLVWAGLALIGGGGLLLAMLLIRRNRRVEAHAALHGARS